MFFIISQHLIEFVFESTVLFDEDRKEVRFCLIELFMATYTETYTCYDFLQILCRINIRIEWKSDGSKSGE